jgi:DNA-binding response OmpR family regulator
MAHVAIVDDDKNFLLYLGGALEAEGHIVDTYDDPLRALPKLIMVPPGVLILNGKIPGMNGIEFFLRFREFSQTPVIFLSSAADYIADVLWDLGLSAEDYVNRPVSSQVIARAVKLLSHRAYRSPTLPKT